MILELYVCVNKELRDKSPNLHSSDDYRCSGLGLSKIRAKGDKFSSDMSDMNLRAMKQFEDMDSFF